MDIKPFVKGSGNESGGVLLSRRSGKKAYLFPTEAAPVIMRSGHANMFWGCVNLSQKAIPLRQMREDRSVRRS